jgi:Co/Zn/Cd efflux system component
MSMDKKPKHLDPAYQAALIICAMLNLTMLFIEGSAGLWIGSAALFADAGDFLEDATVPRTRLCRDWLVGTRTRRGRSRPGFCHGRSRDRGNSPDCRSYSRRRPPSPALMGGVTTLALTVNGYCAYRLIRFRGVDACDLAVDAK